MNPTLLEAIRRFKAENESAIDTDPRVMAMVREQLERDPPPSLAALYGRAVRINREIRKLTPRQFNARYPLQVRKEQKVARKGREGRVKGNGRPEPASPTPEVADRLRTILLQYAKVVAAAETTAELIQAVQQADRYVEAVADLAQQASASAEP